MIRAALVVPFSWTLATHRYGVPLWTKALNLTAKDEGQRRWAGRKTKRGTTHLPDMQLVNTTPMRDLRNPLLEQRDLQLRAAHLTNLPARRTERRGRRCSTIEPLDPMRGQPPHMGERGVQPGAWQGRMLRFQPLHGRLGLERRGKRCGGAWCKAHCCRHFPHLPAPWIE